MPKAIDAKDLVPMDLFIGAEALKIEVVYADATHPENIFGISAYHKNARMILHRDLARMVILASRTLNKKHGWTLILKDGLRPVEAQAALMETDIVKRNPHWLEEPRLLSSPGQGAHPRAMAIDVSVEDKNGHPVDMGTVFDAMVPESARAYDGFSPLVLSNRKELEQAMMMAANSLSLPLLPLPSEWWDFRFTRERTQDLLPLSDNDLPGALKMCSEPSFDAAWQAHFDGLAKSILLSL